MNRLAAEPRGYNALTHHCTQTIRTSRPLPSLRLALVFVLLATGCATPIGIYEVSREAAQRTLMGNATTMRQESFAARQVLLREGLYELFEDDPDAALDVLHERALVSTNPDDLYALSELSFLYAAEREGSCRPRLLRRSTKRKAQPASAAECLTARGRFLASAIYAYAYLFPKEASQRPGRLDSRTRAAADLYNLSLAAVLDTRNGGLALPQDLRAFELGTMHVTMAPDALRWTERDLVEFVPASQFGVRGLRNRYRTSGIGAAYVAAVAPVDESTRRPGSAHLGASVRAAVNAFLRFDDVMEGLRTGEFAGQLEVTPTVGGAEIEVAGQRVALEAEPTVALASALEISRLWDFEIAGYLGGDELPADPGLYMLGPYQPGHVPLVLVHGTASSPARWAEMLNELMADPFIRSHYQPWLFLYSTGNPVLYSAALLRDSLSDTVLDLDPQQRDPALQRMVLVGHSQGGLLVRLQVTASGNHFWRNLTDRPFEDVKLQPETRELLANSMFFEPLPFVSRVIFISTPHRGSFLARGRLGRLAASLFTAPTALIGAGLDLAEAGLDFVGSTLQQGVELARGDEDAAIRGQLRRIPSSVDNMNPKNGFTLTLAELPIAPGVHVNSIIPVTGGEPPAGQNDGVVEYESAHLDGAESEYVVYQASHSTQADPETILEVERILHQHIGDESP